MIVYWAMFAVSALSTLLVGARQSLDERRSALGLISVAILFAVLVGLRYNVGTDWTNYQNTINTMRFVGFSAAMSYKDLGFGLLAWLSTDLGLGIYGINVLCAAVLMYGLARFVRHQPDPWLALTAAVPYLIIVVGMGYIRQAAAIGLLFLALLDFERRSYLRFTVLMGVAALFHGSVLVIFPFAVLVLVRDRRELFIPMLIVALLLYVLILRQRADTFYGMYVERDNVLDSSGALIRVVMNAIPASLYLLLRNRIPLDPSMRYLWTIFSLISISLIAVLFVFPSSTAVDRVALYFIPVQIFLFGHLAVVLTDNPIRARAIDYAVIVYFAGTLFVWLTYASNARNWLPYRFAPLVGINY